MVGLVGQGGPGPKGPFGIKPKLQGPVRSCRKIKVKGISLSTALAPSPLNLTIGCETSSGWSFWTIFKPEWPHTWLGCPSQPRPPVLPPWAPNVKTTVLEKLFSPLCRIPSPPPPSTTGLFPSLLASDPGSCRTLLGPRVVPSHLQGSSGCMVVSDEKVKKLKGSHTFTNVKFKINYDFCRNPIMQIIIIFF